MSVPCAYRLYLPEPWAEDRRRRDARRSGRDSLSAEVGDRGRSRSMRCSRTICRERRSWPTPAMGWSRSFAKQSLRADSPTPWESAKEVSVWPAGRMPAASTALEGSRSPNETVAPLAAASPRIRSRACSRASALGVSEDPLARGHSRNDAVALCTSSRATRSSRLLAPGPRAEEWLVVEWPHRRQSRPSTGSPMLPETASSRGSRPSDQDPLAHRARLRGDEGRARPRSLRGTQLERIPSPRGPMHRRLRVPGGRARSAFPPSASCLLASRSPTQEFPPAGSCPCELSATTQHRSRPCACYMPELSAPLSQLALGAGITRPAEVYDTVVLGRRRVSPPLPLALSNASELS